MTRQYQNTPRTAQGTEIKARITEIRARAMVTPAQGRLIRR